MLIDPNLGKKNSEQEDVITYCDATGFTRSNGDIPQTGICNIINNQLVSFNDIAQNINMNGYQVKNTRQQESSSLSTRSGSRTYILLNSINPTDYQPNELIVINSTGDGLTSIPFNEIESTIGIFLIL